MDQQALSPEGKGWCDGEIWNPVEQPAGPQAQPPRPRCKRHQWLPIGIVASLVICFPIGLILTRPTSWLRRARPTTRSISEPKAIRVGSRPSRCAA